MKKKQETKIQYTIRGIPARTDQLLREKAAEYNCSLNEAALMTLKAGLGESGEALHHDFDKFAGTWVQDDGFDSAIKEFEKIDEELWK